MLAMESLAWALFGIRNVFVVMPVIILFPNLRCQTHPSTPPFNHFAKLTSFCFQFSVSDDQRYHKSCFMELYHPKCDVCKDFVSVESSSHYSILVNILSVHKN